MAMANGRSIPMQGPIRCSIYGWAGGEDTAQLRYIYNMEETRGLSKRKFQTASGRLPGFHS